MAMANFSPIPIPTKGARRQHPGRRRGMDASTAPALGEVVLLSLGAQLHLHQALPLAMVLRPSMVACSGP